MIFLQVNIKQFVNRLHLTKIIYTIARCERYEQMKVNVNGYVHKR